MSDELWNSYPKPNNLDQLGPKEFRAQGSIKNEISETCFASVSKKTQKGESQNDNNGSAQRAEDEDEADIDSDMEFAEETMSQRQKTTAII